MHKGERSVTEPDGQVVCSMIRYYGYKTHLSMDTDTRLITALTTTGSEPDCKRMPELMAVDKAVGFSFSRDVPRLDRALCRKEVPIPRLLTDKLGRVESGIYCTERFKKPVAHIVVGYYLRKTQYVYVAESCISEFLNIRRATSIWRARHLDREIGDSPFPCIQVRLGKVVSYLLGQFLIIGHSTEGHHMACSSVHTPIVGRGNECGYLLFAHSQAICAPMNGATKAMEETSYRWCPAGKAYDGRRAASRSISRVIVQLSYRFIRSVVWFDFNPCCPVHECHLLCSLFTRFQIAGNDMLPIQVEGGHEGAYADRGHVPPFALVGQLLVQFSCCVTRAGAVLRQEHGSCRWK